MRSLSLVTLAAGIIGGAAALDAQSAVLSTFNFNGISNAAPVTYAVDSEDPNVTTGAFSRAAGVAGVNGTGIFNTEGPWFPTLSDAITNNEYVTFSITPDAGYSMTLTSVVFKHHKGQTNAPDNVDLFSSLTGFAAANTLGTRTTSTTQQTATYTLPGGTYSNLTGAVTFRIYLYNGQSNTNRPFDFDDVIINGSVSLLPVSTLTLTSTLPGGSSNVADTSNPYKASGAGNAYVDVIGSSGKYISEIDDLTSNVNKASVAINDVGGEGPTYAMLWLTGTGIDSLLAALEADTAFDIAKFDVSNTDPLYADIQNLLVHYPGFTALAKFNTTSNNGFLNWDFAAHTGVLVDKVAVVPEPAAFGLLALGGALILPRRRRDA